MSRAVKFVRWSPVVYYALALAWNTVMGGIELPDALIQFGVLGALGYLGLAAEQNLVLDESR